MTRITRLQTFVMAVALCIVPLHVYAEASLPSPELTAVFSEANQAYFCDKEGSTKVAPLFGQVGLAYQLNFAALPRLPDDQGQTAPMPADVLAMRWVLHWGSVEAGDVDGLGLTTAQQSAIQSIRYDLAEHLAWLAENPKKSKYRLDPATPLASINTPDARDAALRRLFAPVLGGSEAPLRILCVFRDGTAAPPKPPAEPSDGRVIVALRGKIDDLAVVRAPAGSERDVEAFKKASGANLSFTDDDVKGSSVLTAEAVVGVGTQLGPNDAAFLFLHYLASTSETQAPGDDDDSKDIRALSPGLMYRRSFGDEDGQGAYGTFTAVAYQTDDMAKDSTILRARVGLVDLAYLPSGAKAVCGATRTSGPLDFDCRAGLFAEYGRVQDAGSNTDFQSLVDDNYAGIGGELTLRFSLPGVKPLAPLSFSIGYRYMRILSGDLENPGRLSMDLTYAIPDSNFSIGLSQTRGENFETFEEEDLTKVVFAFKY